MGTGDVRIALRHPGNHSAPEPRSLEHVRLVDGAQPAASHPGQLERAHRNPLDLWSAVSHGVDGSLAARGHVPSLGPAEIEAPRELPNHQEVDVLDALGAQCGDGDHRRIDANRPQVGEEAEAFAQPEQRRTRPDGAVRRRIVPFGSPDRAEQDRVRRLAESQRLWPQRDAIGIDGGTAHKVGHIVEAEPHPTGGRVQHSASRLGHLGPDAIPGEYDDTRGQGHARTSSLPWSARF